jgi:hypothetical protein
MAVVFVLLFRVDDELDLLALAPVDDEPDLLALAPVVAAALPPLVAAADFEADEVEDFEDAVRQQSIERSGTEEETQTRKLLILPS